MSRRAYCLAALVAALLASGCGAASSPQGPRHALVTVLADLAAARNTAVCGDLTPGAVSELALEFGGENCAQTVGAATRYLASSPAERHSVARAKVLPALDLPLSPAPYYAGERTARARVQFDDPVLGERQFADMSLRFEHGRWRVGSGIDLLFTLLH